MNQEERKIFKELPKEVVKKTPKNGRENKVLLESIVSEAEELVHEERKENR